MFNFFNSLQNLFPVHSTCLRSAGVKSAEKNWLLYRHQLGIDRLSNKCTFVLEVQHHFPIHFKRVQSVWSLLMEKSCPGKRATLPSEPTLATVYEEKLTTFSESTVFAHVVFV